MSRLDARPEIGALLVTGGLLVFGACSFGPQTDPTRFYLLSAREGQAQADLEVDRKDRINIGIGPFTIPGYLDRSHFVRRIGPNEVRPVEAARWAESIDEGFERVLAANLDERLPMVDVYSHPWHATVLTQWIVTGNVHRFETDAAGEAVLDVTWRVLDPERQPTSVGKRSVLTSRTTASTVDAEVAALSEVVDRFAALLADAIREEGPALLQNR